MDYRVRGLPVLRCSLKQQLGDANAAWHDAQHWGVSITCFTASHLYAFEQTIRSLEHWGKKVQMWH